MMPQGRVSDTLAIHHLNDMQRDLQVQQQEGEWF
jgi:hypothetical protein